MPEVTVIADDLTGAADCGIAFARSGVSTFVGVGDGAPPSAARVLSLDTDTRRMERDVAAERTLDAARRAYASGSRAVYKKIDSTLRGHVGAELAAAHQAAREVAGAAGPAVVLLAPAFPATGRTTRGGRVLVHGVPLAETELWRTSGTSGPPDPAGMLRESGLRAAPLGCDELRQAPGAVAGRIEALLRDGWQAVVCDAEEDDDLRRIAEAGAEVRASVVWAGSGGLARWLPAALRLRPDPGRPGWPAAGGRPVLVAVGSRAGAAREQAAVLALRGAAALAAPPDVLLGGARSPGWPTLASALHDALAAGRDVALAVAPEPLVPLEQGPVLAGALGRLVAAEAPLLGGVVATGGDVARAVLGALGAPGLELVGEVEPGVPIGVAHPRSDVGARPLPVVTKAGAFGDREALERARAALRAGSA